MITTLGPATSWRIIHDGKTVLLLAELSGFTETAHTAFEAATQRECVAVARSLGLAVPDDMAELFAGDTAIPAGVPQQVTMRQARLALLSAGLLDDVEAAIAALPSPQKEAAKIEWEYSQEVQRHNGFVSVLSPLLGMTDEQLDDLFVQGAKL